jgi:hypothetical protein
VAHTVTTTTSGIVNLVVLPYFDKSYSNSALESVTKIANDPDGGISDSDDITWGDRVEVWSDAQYVTVVVDKSAPGAMVSTGSTTGATLAFGTAGTDYVSSSASGEVTTITYGGKTNFALGFADYSGIADNAGVGIASGSPYRPRMRDADQSGIRWSWSIDGVRSADAEGSTWVTDNAANISGGVYRDPAWYNLVPGADAELADKPAAISNITVMLASDNSATHTIRLYYKDSLGNVTPATEGADSGYRVKYYLSSLTAITAWTATYDPSSASITLSWTKPVSDYTGATVA